MFESLLNGGPLPSVKEYVFLQTTSTQTSTWVVPSDVDSICVVCVGNGAQGGGGLSYRNDIPVTPGETLTLSFAPSQTGGNSGIGTRLLRGSAILCVAFAGGVANSGGAIKVGGFGGKVANSINTGGGNGGNGGYWTSGAEAGGGAGGYAGNGGTATNEVTTNTSGGVNSGSGSGARVVGSGLVRGGDVGLYGIGETGSSAPTGSTQRGVDGSVSAAMCGGGGFISRTVFNGGVRIIWGPGVSFPSNAK